MVWSRTSPERPSLPGAAIRPRRAAVAVLLLGLGLGWALESMPERVAWETEVLQGIGVEALRGTTAGRQALVGSAGYGLLPPLAAVVAGLPFEFFPVPWPRAAMWIGAFSMAAAVVLTGSGVCGHGRLRRAIPAVAAMLAAPSFVVLAGAAPAALGVAFSLWVLLCVLDFCATGRCRSLVLGAIGMALAALCPLDTFPWLLTMAALVPLHALVRTGRRRRWPGTTLLWMLPMLYALGVWSLLNWLILADPLFFLRGLPQSFSVPAALAAVRDEGALERFAVLAGLAGVGIGGVRRDARILVPGLAALSAWGCRLVWHGLGMDWAATGLAFVLLAAALLTLAGIHAGWARHRPVAARIFMLSPLAAAALTLYADSGAPLQAAPSMHRTDLNRLERFVLSESEHSRIFVCGFDSLGLLWHRTDTRLQPVLDFHPDALLADYDRQSLYLLVPRPEGRTSVDAVFARFPGMYVHGVEQGLMIGDWEIWRLFILVSADAPMGEALE